MKSRIISTVGCTMTIKEACNAWFNSNLYLKQEVFFPYKISKYYLYQAQKARNG